MTYIECLGVHGSGKTTVAQAFVSLLRNMGNAVLTEKSAEQTGGWRLFCEKAGKYQLIVVPALSVFRTQIGTYMRQHVQGDLMRQFMLAHPQLMQIVMNGVVKLQAGQVAEERMLENFFQTAAVYQLAQQSLREREALIVEEGFCQQAYHVLASRAGDVSDEAIEQYLSLIPRPAYLLAVVTPPEECEERLRARQKYPRVLERLNSQEKLAYLRRRAAFHERIIASANKRGIAVLSINNSRNADVKGQLHALLSTHGATI